MNHEWMRAIRYYGILDTAYVEPSHWLEKYEDLRNGGSGIIQIRAKRESRSERRKLIASVIDHREASSSEIHPPLIVNDDLELCLQFPDIGLHIGQEDTPPLLAREKLGPNRILGLSTHSIDQASEAMRLPSGVIDYFAIGPVFATQTKPNYEPVGLELVRWVASREPVLPYFCIGGINRQNAHLVSKAGGSRVVTVSDALRDRDTSRAVKETIALLG